MNQLLSPSRIYYLIYNGEISLDFTEILYIFVLKLVVQTILDLGDFSGVVFNISIQVKKGENSARNMYEKHMPIFFAIIYPVD